MVDRSSENLANQEALIKFLEVIPNASRYVIISAILSLCSGKRATRELLFGQNRYRLPKKCFTREITPNFQKANIMNTNEVSVCTITDEILEPPQDFQIFSAVFPLPLVNVVVRQKVAISRVSSRSGAFFNNMDMGEGGQKYHFF